MSNDSFHCARCGAPLATPDSVCEQCDRDLAVPVAKPDPAIGKYRCPECACKFDRPNVIYKRARWYLPDSLEAKCPYCGCLLRDRTLTWSPRPLSQLVAFILLFKVVFGIDDNWMKPIAILLLLFLAVDIFFLIRYFRSEYRYTAAKRQKPSKQ